MIDQTPLDVEAILASLVRHRVDFVVIGGVASQTHGSMRMTADLDLIPAPTPENLERLAKALRSLGARVLNAGREMERITAELLPQATIWQFSTAAGGIDVIHEAPGSRPFDELRGDALLIGLGELEIPIVGLDDLIAMKLARGRPVDLEDVRTLTSPPDDGSPPPEIP